MTRFTPQFIDELRTRIKPSDVIGKQVRLRQKGGGEYEALCPFHKEKSPSFTVSDPKGFYHCFGCGAHGDVIKFVMETDGLRYPEAITRLAEHYGIPLPIIRENPKQREEEKKKPDLYQVMEAASRWYQQQLFSNKGLVAQRYLKSRELPESIVRLFGLGYAPDERYALKDAMLRAGFGEDMLVESGMLIRNERGETYDRFRGRVMFPIWDNAERIIAFGGRILGEGQPKYLNSPETPIFHKGHVLYAAKDARKAAYKAGKLVVTEGYMDVIALYKAGIPYAVAPLGTAVTESHLTQLWRIVSEPVMCLDGDAAGQRAMARATDLALPLLAPGTSLRFAILPEKMDPDDVIRNQGTDVMETLLDHALPLSEVVWNIEYNAEPARTPEQRAGLEKRLNARVAQIAHPELKKHYQQFFKEKMWSLSKKQWGKDRTEAAVPTRLMGVNLAKAEDSALRYQQLLLTGAFYYPEILEEADIHEEFCHLEYTDPDMQGLHDALISWDNQGEEGMLYGILREHLENEGLAHYISTIEQVASAMHSPFAEQTLLLEDAKENWRMLLKRYHLEMLSRDHQKAVEQMAHEMTETRWMQVQELQKQIDGLKKVLDIP